VTALVVTETPPPQPEREAAEAGRAESLPAEQPSVARRINRLPELASAAGPTFTAVGLALFVVLNLASTAVYAPLGVTPADVGLGYADLLAQSAVGVTAGFLIALLIGGVTALLRSQPGRRPAWATLAVIAAVAVVELDIALALPVLDHPLISVTELAVFMVAVVASVVTLLRRPALRQRALVEATRPGLALGLVSLTLAAGLAGAMHDGITSLREGSRPSNLLVGVPPPWHAETARVTWTSGSAPTGLELPPCLLYLGASDGTVVLYDSRERLRRALLVRADHVAIVITHDRAKCPT
jgi:hypothetical protein